MTRYDAMQQEITKTLSDSKDRQRKLSKEIFILIAELEQEVKRETKIVNYDNKLVSQQLFHYVESDFLLAVKTVDSEQVIEFPEYIGIYMQDRIQMITEKQAQIEQIIVETQIDVAEQRSNFLSDKALRESV